MVLLYGSMQGISKIHRNFSDVFGTIYLSRLLTNKYDLNTDANTPLKFAAQQYSLRHTLIAL